jgi:hypothetical protein
MTVEMHESAGTDPMETIEGLQNYYWSFSDRAVFAK